MHVDTLPNRFKSFKSNHNFCSPYLPTPLCHRYNVTAPTPCTLHPIAHISFFYHGSKLESLLGASFYGDMLEIFFF